VKFSRKYLVKSMKILHFAGLHLDRSFADGGLPASVGRIRREGLIETFIQICEIANSRAVDAVTIAGDLFEEATVMLATLNMLSEQFTKLAPIQVLIAPGQSDAYSQDSIYAQWHFPENVHIFDAQSLSAFHLLPEITIWGAAYPHPPKSKLLRSLKKASKGIDLLLLHEPNARPSKNKNIKLALLGGEHHYRTFSGGVMVGSPEIIEPGVEKLEYGVCLVTHEQGDIKTEFIKTGTWQYEYTEVDLSECENLGSLPITCW
jgi:DNA repair exonuclease SbcCD nuclease subunit